KDHLFLDALRRFSRLQSVVVASVGLPRHIAHAILSVPRLRHLQIHYSLCLGSALHGGLTRASFPTPPQLVSFSKTRKDFSPHPKPNLDEGWLPVLIKSTSSTLGEIRLTGKEVPERVFHKNDWPHLRELIIRSARPVLRHPRSMTMLSVRSRVPNLRVLKLELAQHAQTERIPFWPQGWTPGFPWPDLEVLTVTYSDPDDEFLAHLPHTPRQLSLCCWPRHHILESHQKWASPIPTATEMPRILRRSTSNYPNQLTHLDNEFDSDAQDSLLVQHIGTSFPALCFLQF
ncbi:hypothetical protein BD413DRAFT_438927, partial [Trametes elegans]